MTDHTIAIIAVILQALELPVLTRILWQGEFIMKYEKGVYELHTKKETEREAWRDAKRRAVVKKLEYEAAVEEAKKLEATQEESNGG